MTRIAKREAHGRQSMRALLKPAPGQRVAFETFYESYSMLERWENTKAEPLTAIHFLGLIGRWGFRTQIVNGRVYLLDMQFARTPAVGE